MPYSDIVTNQRKLLRGSFEDQRFVVPYSSQTGMAGTYQNERFVTPPFFSRGLGAWTDWFSGNTDIAGQSIPNIALAGAAAFLAFTFLGKRGRR